jgi:hypothetical protein
MRFTTLWLTVLTAFCMVTIISTHAARGQEFQNLDFEASVVETGETFTFARVPGWTFSGEETFSQPFGTDALFFGVHIGLVPLQRMASDLVDANGPPPTQGHFSVWMGPAPHQDYAALFPWIEQSGRVPTEARSIRLAGQLDPLFVRDPSLRGWHLTLGGTEIPLIELPNGVLSGDVTALAGSTVPLRIAIDQSYHLAVHGSKIRTNFLFDAIRFSPLEFTEVPEPAGGLLATIGLASYALVSHRWRSGTGRALD